jgi:imidazole glycerol-phosphate synthase subunit HisH
MARLAIIDSGGANIASLQFAIERLGVEATLTTDPSKLAAASHVILPGVGAAADCMARLEALNLTDTIRSLRQPLLGICVGMQLLFEGSEEGDVACLGILPGRVRRFPNLAGMPVPHMGWNQLNITRPTPLLTGLTADDYVYYVHSYAAPVSTDTVATTDYSNRFSAAVQRDNVFGVQFHPERSARPGALILANFLKV